MIINSYRFGTYIAANSNVPTILQNTDWTKLDNSTGNNDQFIMTVNVGSTVFVVVSHMMLNGNNDTAIVSDNTQSTGYAQQCKSICGTGGGANHRGSVQIHKSDVFLSSHFGGASSGSVKVFVKSSDASFANVRMGWVALEVSNIANADIVSTDFAACNTGSVNLGNNSPNVFMSGWSTQNSFIIAAAMSTVGSFNTCSYPASSHGGPAWINLCQHNESTNTGTGNVRIIENYMYSTSNTGTLDADWGTGFASTPWAALIASFPNN